MSSLTVAWSMCAAASFMLTGIHVSLWFKDRLGWVYLLSALMALAAGANALAELGLMRADSLDTYRTLLKLENLSVFLLLVLMVWFVYAHFGTARLWLAWTITAMWSTGIVVNFLSPNSLTFSELLALESTNTCPSSLFVREVRSAH